MSLRNVLTTLRHLLPRAVLGLVLLAAFAWCLGAIWFSELGPAPLRWAGMAVFTAIFPVLLLRGAEVRYVVLTFLAAFAGIVLLFHLRRPALDRHWEPEMARAPEIAREGDVVTIRNVRDCRYSSETEFEVRWDDRTYDLGALRTLDLMVERFHPSDAPAHTFLSFGFGADEATREYVTVSVEIRREAGEAFAPLRALYRNYELLYVVADERDVLELRTNHRRSRTYLFPVESTPDLTRDVFLSMLERADALGREPQYYNTATSTCTTNIVMHANRMVPGRVPMHLAVLLPGYAGRFAHEIGLIDLNTLGLPPDATFEEVETACRVDDDAQALIDLGGFSHAIRAARRVSR